MSVYDYSKKVIPLQKNKAMETLKVHPPKGITLRQAKSVLKSLNFVVIEEKDDAKMTKEEYYAMIEKASQEESVHISREDMRKLLLGTDGK